MKLCDVETLIRQLMTEQGLIQAGWTFRLSHSLTFAGCCYFKEARIDISKEFIKINNKKLITEIILHEMAHALSCSANHKDKPWIEWCNHLGVSSSPWVPKNTRVPPFRHKAQCPTCRRIFKYFRKSKFEHSCDFCGGSKFNKDFTLKWIE